MPSTIRIGIRPRIFDIALILLFFLIATKRPRVKYACAWMITGRGRTYTPSMSLSMLHFKFQQHQRQRQLPTTTQFLGMSNPTKLDTNQLPTRGQCGTRTVSMLANAAIGPLFTAQQHQQHEPQQQQQQQQQHEYQQQQQQHEPLQSSMSLDSWEQQRTATTATTATTTRERLYRVICHVSTFTSLPLSVVLDATDALGRFEVVPSSLPRGTTTTIATPTTDPIHPENNMNAKHDNNISKDGNGYDTCPKQILLDRVLLVAESLTHVASASEPITNDTNSNRENASTINTTCTASDASIATKKNRTKKSVWVALQRASASLFLNNSGGRCRGTCTYDISSHAALSMSAACVYAALALVDIENDDDGNESNRAAASAMGATVLSQRRTWQQQQQQLPSNATSCSIPSSPMDTTINTIPEEIMRALLDLSNNTPHPGTKSTIIDLQIVTSLARSFGVVHGGDEATATIRRVLRLHPTVPHDTKTESNFRNNETIIPVDDDSERIKEVAAALALAAQVRPWHAGLDPFSLVQAAVSFDLWHQAEQICSAAVADATKMTMHESMTAAATSFSARTAVQALVDAALDAKIYRQADHYATLFYDSGGKSRFIDARFLHACDTISKLVQKKRQLPLIERQVARVDRAVEKVFLQEQNINPSHCETNFEEAMEVKEEDQITTAEAAKKDIRIFSLRKVQESGDVDVAHRLAKIWGVVDALYNKQEIAAAAAARREQYLQWEDVMLPDKNELQVPAPELASTPQDLFRVFKQLYHSYDDNNNNKGLVFGFDVEWGDNHAGAAVLQIATAHAVALVDVLALSVTLDGANALEQTVGRLLSSNTNDNNKANGCKINSVVVGFGCRQDLSRLFSSPCARENHWLAAGGTDAVVDLQKLVATDEPRLRKLGLSRVCEHYLGKPLDKAEQCSIWTARPLSRDQRVYAALDAWVCVAVHAKIVRA